MDKIDRLLEYIHRTNPEMTRQKLIEELGESDYSAKSIYFWRFKIQIPKNFRIKKVPPYLWLFQFQKSVRKILQKLVENLQRTHTTL